MHLSKYLKRGDATKLAAKLGVSVSTVTRWSKGQTKPKGGALPQIRKATRGRVRAADFYPDTETTKS